MKDAPEKVVRSKDVMDALSDLFDLLGQQRMPANQFGLLVYQKLTVVPEFYAANLVNTEETNGD